MKLNELFKNTSYDDTLFSSEAITTIEKGIFTKNIKEETLDVEENEELEEAYEE